MRGSFLSRNGTVWKVEIFRDGATIEAEQELEFPAREPLLIEWERRDKEQPVCGSVCTLTLLSPGDRTYLDLYTIKAGSVTIEVRRDGRLYWSGTLDPEFYEEPYSSAYGYEVTLTFSDFGLLDRIPYALAGDRTLRELVEHALDEARLTYTAIDTSMLTTSLADGEPPLKLADLSVRSENWYDEDGEPSTLMEVLEGMLQPLALKMVQRAGKIWIYDLNGLYLSGADAEVRWESDDQTLGTDKVYNNAKVTFSPYAAASVGSSEIEYTGTYSKKDTNLTSDKPTDGREYYTYYTNHKDAIMPDGRWDYDLKSFTVFLSATEGKGLAYLAGGARYVHFEPLASGQQADAVAVTLYTGGHGDLGSGLPRRLLYAPTAPGSSVLLRTKPVHVQRLSAAEAERHYLRVTMDLLCDPRYNPFEEGKDGNEKGDYGSWQKVRLLNLNARITVRDGNGTALCHYDNSAVGSQEGQMPTLAGTLGTWKSGAGASNACSLQWRDAEDLAGGCGVLGWKKNRQCVAGPTTLESFMGNRKELPKSFSGMEPGQYMPYPPQGGWIDVEVFFGVEPTGDFKESKDKLRGFLRWLCYKAPKVEVLDRDSVQSPTESEDVEYTGVVNADAREDIEIDTVCGTAEHPTPTANGNYLRTSDGLQVATLHRAGRTTQAEQLLIGTLYSQYADRKAKLSGTLRLLADGVRTYTDAAMPGVRFCVLADRQDVIADEGEVELVELRPDEYDDK